MVGMIIISGEPRSGTSMACMIVRELGFSLAGTKNPCGYADDGNLDGYWEVPGVVMNGLTDGIVKGTLPPKYTTPITEDAIKLLTCAVVGSDDKYIDKIIYCVRNPIEVIASQKRRAWQEKFPIDDEHNHELVLYRSYCISMFNLLSNIIPKYEDVMIMNYNIAVFNPKLMVDSIANFLGVKPTKKAYKVIKEKYYRHRG
jgi:hypothetical protein